VRDGQFVVGFSGTLVEKKGIVEFIDVARLMAAKVPEAVFVVAGAPKPGEEGILTRLKDRVAEAGLDGRLHWLGFVEDLHMVMPGMDVFLFPAHDEAFGRVIIEAMACGVVPVSSLAGGPREIIEDGRTGFLKPYTDISSFAEALMLLYRDAALRSGMAAAARDAVVSRFSIAAMLSGVRDVILSAVNKG
jgi:glycosyltransferase involved in cell wall biosynthesis